MYNFELYEHFLFYEFSKNELLRCQICGSVVAHRKIWRTSILIYLY